MNKTITLLMVYICLIAPTTTFAIQLIYKDNKGHYHYRCTDKAGGKTIVIYRKEGIFVNGPNGQIFYPLDATSAKRYKENIKITEKYARIGCKEKVRQENLPY